MSHLQLPSDEARHDGFHAFHALACGQNDFEEAKADAVRLIADATGLEEDRISIWVKSVHQAAVTP